MIGEDMTSNRSWVVDIGLADVVGKRRGPRNGHPRAYFLPISTHFIIPALNPLGFFAVLRVVLLPKFLRTLGHLK